MTSYTYDTATRHELDDQRLYGMIAMADPWLDLWELDLGPIPTDDDELSYYARAAELEAADAASYY